MHHHNTYKYFWSDQSNIPTYSWSMSRHSSFNSLISRIINICSSSWRILQHKWMNQFFCWFSPYIDYLVKHLNFANKYADMYFIKFTCDGRWDLQPNKYCSIVWAFIEYAPILYDACHVWKKCEFANKMMHLGYVIYTQVLITKNKKTIH